MRGLRRRLLHLRAAWAQLVALYVMHGIPPGERPRRVVSSYTEEAAAASPEAFHAWLYTMAARGADVRADIMTLQYLAEVEE